MKEYLHKVKENEVNGKNYLEKTRPLICIVAVDEAWGIGCKNTLLTYVPEDLHFFKEITQGHTMLIGRKTLESLPYGLPLPKREHIVMTQEVEKQKQVYEKRFNLMKEKSLTRSLPCFIASWEELGEKLKKNHEQLFVDGEKQVFLIGGAKLYHEGLAYCSFSILTHLHHVFPEAEVFFPQLEEGEWQEIEKSPRLYSPSAQLSYHHTLYAHKTSFQNKAAMEGMKKIFQRQFT